MLSRLQATPHLFKTYYTRVCRERNPNVLQNITSKRWSGHNNMEILPSNADWFHLKNWMHFYMLLGLIPAAVISTIVGIRANPELSEVPDGYEPRHWEYYKHPITRFLAKHFYTSIEQDHEVMMGYFEYQSEAEITKKITERVQKVMRFYNDHRSTYFLPYHGDYTRIGREEGQAHIPHTGTSFNTYYDMAFDPDVAVNPIEGYPNGPVSKD